MKATGRAQSRRLAVHRFVRRAALAIASCGVLALGLGAATAAVVINTTESLAPGIYSRALSDMPLHRGDIVAFCPPPVAVAYNQHYVMAKSFGAYCPGAGGSIYLKLVAALPGDRVTLSDRGVSVNGGRVLPGSVPLRVIDGGLTGDARRPHALPRFHHGTTVVPAGMVWVYTEQWYSFDSRYYGPVTPAHRMRPLWTSSMAICSAVPPRVATMQLQASRR